MDVLTPRSLDEALALEAEHPAAVPIQGGTDVMVALNFDRARPEAILNLNEVAELRGWSRENGTLRLGAGLTYAEAMSGALAEALPALAEASRTVGSPQIRNRGTIGGNLGTASPAGDALPPLLVEGARVELASARGVRELPLAGLPARRQAQRARRRRADRRGARRAERPAADVHEDRPAQRDGHRGLLARRSSRIASAESCEPRSGRRLLACLSSPLRSTTPTAFPEQVAAAASPIDDVRGTAAYRRHALRVLTQRALERCLRECIVHCLAGVRIELTRSTASGARRTSGPARAC